MHLFWYSNDYAHTICLVAYALFLNYKLTVKQMAYDFTRIYSTNSTKSTLFIYPVALHPLSTHPPHYPPHHFTSTVCYSFTMPYNLLHYFTSTLLIRNAPYNLSHYFTSTLLIHNAPYNLLHCLHLLYSFTMHLIIYPIVYIYFAKSQCTL